MTRLFAALALALATALAAPLAGTSPALAQDYAEPPFFEQAVADGTLPPLAERLPAAPLVVDMAAIGKQNGQYGGEISWLAGRARDIRIMTVYGYARLVGYTAEFELAPDLLESFDVEEGRIFTLHLRPGHKWSDGQPFTSEDFRYFWEDVETNPDLSPYGPDSRLLVDGELPKVEILDETTVRYSWSKPNPGFLPAMAGPSPVFIFAPAHYLKQFHAKYADADALAKLVADSGEQNWSDLHIRRGDLYDVDNPDLPTLQPWRNTTAPPADRFVFERNPYFHRVDTAGHQLPYLDRVIVNISDPSLIPAKVAAGETDLQARHLRFDNVTFLKEGEARGGYTVLLWPNALGAEVALYPNLNAADPGWREVLRDARFRRALSLAIDRDEINNIIYFGLARPSQNTALPTSPAFSEERAMRWATFDVEQANALLDEMGLTERNAQGTRLLPDGRPAEIVVEMSGERTEESDILQLIGDTWRQIGIAVFPTVSQRDVFRTRIFAGEAMMSMWFGYDNGLFTADTVPNELAPVDQNWLQYPAWGQYVQTQGDAGETPDLDWAQQLMTLYREWLVTVDPDRRLAITNEMLDIHADQVDSIGVVQGVLQPVVVSNGLANVPADGLYSWDPGAHFGVYRPDTFYLTAP